MRSRASAPGKVILFGEHFVVYGVKAILCSINKRISATSQFLDERKVKIRSVLGEAELSIDSLHNSNLSATSFMKPFFYIVKKALEEHRKNKGIEIVIESQIPAGIGIRSSSAACVAVTASVNGFFQRLSKPELAMLAIRKIDINMFGLLMSKNQDLLQKINVSTEKIDLLVREAKKTAYGAKITGAGGGGCIVSLVDNSNSAASINNLKKITDCFPVKVDYQGVRYI